MIATLMLVATLASPTPSPTGLPGPLKVIVTVRSSTFCSRFASHANAAITAALQNDSTLGTLVFVLRNRDLAGNDIERRNMLQSLNKMADAVAMNYKAGMSEIASLRELERKASDPAEKEALKASADSLGGALYRQHLIVRDLDGFLAYEYAADMRREDPDSSQAQMKQASAPDAGMIRPPGSVINIPGIQDVALAGNETRDDDAAMALAASRDFAARLPAVTGDEQNAATAFTAAAGGC
jgi:hypothetical protein